MDSLQGGMEPLQIIASVDNDLATIAAEYQSVQTIDEQATVVYCQKLTKLAQAVSEKTRQQYELYLLLLCKIMDQLRQIYVSLAPTMARLQMCQQLFVLCTKAILGIQWKQLADDSPGKNGMRVVLSATHSMLSVAGYTRIQLLLTLMDDHWDNPILSKIMANDCPDEEEAKTYILNEDPMVLKLRVELLLEEDCEEFVINLCHWAALHPMLKDDIYLRQTQLLLLHKHNMVTRFREECEKISCHFGVQIVMSLEQLRQHQSVCVVLAQTFLIQDWINPKEYCCTNELLRLWIKHQHQIDADQEKFSDSIWSIAKLSRNTKQVAFLISVLQQQCGRDKFLQLLTDLAIYALNLDKGFLECAKSFQDDEAIAMSEKAIARTCVHIHNLYQGINLQVQQRSIITAFALDPTPPHFTDLVKIYEQKYQLAQDGPKKPIQKKISYLDVTGKSSSMNLSGLREALPNSGQASQTNLLTFAQPSPSTSAGPSIAGSPSPIKITNEPKMQIQSDMGCARILEKGDDKGGTINPATLYEMDRLLKLFRPWFFDPLLPWKELYIVARDYIAHNKTVSTEVETKIRATLKSIKDEQDKTCDTVQTEQGTIVGRDQFLKHTLELQRKAFRRRRGRPRLKDIEYSRDKEEQKSNTLEKMYKMVFKCLICSTLFDDVPKLKEHVRLVCRPEGPESESKPDQASESTSKPPISCPVFKCRLCEALNTSLQAFQLHLSTKHASVCDGTGSNIKICHVYRCKYCKIFFNKREDLQQHLTVCPVKLQKIARGEISAKSSGDSPESISISNDSCKKTSPGTAQGLTRGDSETPIVAKKRGRKKKSEMGADNPKKGVLFHSLDSTSETSKQNRHKKAASNDVDSDDPDNKQGRKLFPRKSKDVAKQNTATRELIEKLLTAKSDDDCDSVRKAKTKHANKPHNQCEVCATKFSNRKILVQHYAIQHIRPYKFFNNKGKNAFMCFYCKKFFETFLNYVNHIHEHDTTLQFEIKKYKAEHPNEIPACKSSSSDSSDEEILPKLNKGNVALPKVPSTDSSTEIETAESLTEDSTPEVPCSTIDEISRDKIEKNNLVSIQMDSKTETVGKISNTGIDASSLDRLPSISSKLPLQLGQDAQPVEPSSNLEVIQSTQNVQHFPNQTQRIEELTAQKDSSTQELNAVQETANQGEPTMVVQKQEASHVPEVPSSFEHHLEKQDITNFIDNTEVSENQEISESHVVLSEKLAERDRTNVCETDPENIPVSEKDEPDQIIEESKPLDLKDNFSCSTETATEVIAAQERLTEESSLSSSEEISCSEYEPSPRPSSCTDVSEPVTQQSTVVVESATIESLDEEFSQFRTAPVELQSGIVPSEMTPIPMDWNLALNPLETSPHQNKLSTETKKDVSSSEIGLCKSTEESASSIEESDIEETLVKTSLDDKMETEKDFGNSGSQESSSVDELSSIVSTSEDTDSEVVDAILESGDKNIGNDENDKDPLPSPDCGHPPDLELTEIEMSATTLCPNCGQLVPADASMFAPDSPQKSLLPQLNLSSPHSAKQQQDWCKLLSKQVSVTISAKERALCSLAAKKSNEASPLRATHKEHVDSEGMKNRRRSSKSLSSKLDTRFPSKQPVVKLQLLDDQTVSQFIPQQCQSTKKVAHDQTDERRALDNNAVATPDVGSVQYGSALGKSRENSSRRSRIASNRRSSFPIPGRIENPKPSIPRPGSHDFTHQTKKGNLCASRPLENVSCGEAYSGVASKRAGRRNKRSFSNEDTALSRTQPAVKTEVIIDTVDISGICALFVDDEGDFDPIGKSDHTEFSSEGSPGTPKKQTLREDSKAPIENKLGNMGPEEANRRDGSLVEAQKVHSPDEGLNAQQKVFNGRQSPSMMVKEKDSTSDINKKPLDERNLFKELKGETVAIGSENQCDMKGDTDSSSASAHSVTERLGEVLSPEKWTSKSPLENELKEQQMNNHENVNLDTSSSSSKKISKVDSESHSENITTPGDTTKTEHLDMQCSCITQKCACMTIESPASLSSQKQEKAYTAKQNVSEAAVDLCVYSSNNRSTDNDYQHNITNEAKSDSVNPKQLPKKREMDQTSQSEASKAIASSLFQEDVGLLARAPAKLSVEDEVIVDDITVEAVKAAYRPPESEKTVCKEPTQDIKAEPNMKLSVDVEVNVVKTVEAAKSSPVESGNTVTDDSNQDTEAELELAHVDIDRGLSVLQDAVMEAEADFVEQSTKILSSESPHSAEIKSGQLEILKQSMATSATLSSKPVAQQHLKASVNATSTCGQKEEISAVPEDPMTVLLKEIQNLNEEPVETALEEMVPSVYVPPVAANEDITAISISENDNIEGAQANRTEVNSITPKMFYGHSDSVLRHEKLFDNMEVEKSDEETVNLAVNEKTEPFQLSKGETCLNKKYEPSTTCVINNTGALNDTANTPKAVVTEAAQAVPLVLIASALTERTSEIDPVVGLKMEETEVSKSPYPHSPGPSTPFQPSFTCVTNEKVQKKAEKVLENITEDSVVLVSEADKTAKVSSSNTSTFPESDDYISAEVDLSKVNIIPVDTADGRIVPEVETQADSASPKVGKFSVPNRIHLSPHHSSADSFYMENASASPEKANISQEDETSKYETLEPTNLIHPSLKNATSVDIDCSRERTGVQLTVIPDMKMDIENRSAVTSEPQNSDGWCDLTEDKCHSPAAEVVHEASLPTPEASSSEKSTFAEEIHSDTVEASKSSKVDAIQSSKEGANLSTSSSGKRDQFSSKDDLSPHSTAVSELKLMADAGDPDGISSSGCDSETSAEVMATLEVMTTLTTTVCNSAESKESSVFQSAPSNSPDESTSPNFTEASVLPSNSALSQPVLPRTAMAPNSDIHQITTVPPINDLHHTSTVVPDSNFHQMPRTQDESVEEATVVPDNSTIIASGCVKALETTEFGGLSLHSEKEVTVAVEIGQPKRPETPDDKIASTDTMEYEEQSLVTTKELETPVPTELKSSMHAVSVDVIERTQEPIIKESSTRSLTNDSTGIQMLNHSTNLQEVQWDTFAADSVVTGPFTDDPKLGLKDHTIHDCEEMTVQCGAENPDIQPTVDNTVHISSKESNQIHSGESDLLPVLSPEEYPFIEPSDNDEGGRSLSNEADIAEMPHATEKCGQETQHILQTFDELREGASRVNSLNLGKQTNTDCPCTQPNSKPDSLCMGDSEVKETKFTSEEPSTGSGGYGTDKLLSEVQSADQKSIENLTETEVKMEPPSADDSFMLPSEENAQDTEDEPPRNDQENKESTTEEHVLPCQSTRSQMRLRNSKEIIVETKNSPLSKKTPTEDITDIECQKSINNESKSLSADVQSTDEVKEEDCMRADANTSLNESCTEEKVSLEKAQNVHSSVLLKNNDKQSRIETRLITRHRKERKHGTDRLHLNDDEKKKQSLESVDEDGMADKRKTRGFARYRNDKNKQTDVKAGNAPTPLEKEETQEDISKIESNHNPSLSLEGFDSEEPQNLENSETIGSRNQEDFKPEIGSANVVLFRNKDSAQVEIDMNASPGEIEKNPTTISREQSLSPESVGSLEEELQETVRETRQLSQHRKNKRKEMDDNVDENSKEQADKKKTKSEKEDKLETLQHFESESDKVDRAETNDCDSLKAEGERKTRHRSLTPPFPSSRPKRKRTRTCIDDDYIYSYPVKKPKQSKMEENQKIDPVSNNSTSNPHRPVTRLRSCSPLIQQVHPINAETAKSVKRKKCSTLEDLSNTVPVRSNRKREQVTPTALQLSDHGSSATTSGETPSTSSKSPVPENNENPLKLIPIVLRSGKRTVTIPEDIEPQTQMTTRTESISSVKTETSDNGSQQSSLKEKTLVANDQKKQRHKGRSKADTSNAETSKRHETVTRESKSTKKQDMRICQSGTKNSKDSKSQSKDVPSADLSQSGTKDSKNLKSSSTKADVSPGYKGSKQLSMKTEISDNRSQQNNLKEKALSAIDQKKQRRSRTETTNTETPKLHEVVATESKLMKKQDLDICQSNTKDPKESKSLTKVPSEVNQSNTTDSKDLKSSSTKTDVSPGYKGPADNLSIKTETTENCSQQNTGNEKTLADPKNHSQSVQRKRRSRAATTNAETPKLQEAVITESNSMKKQDSDICQSDTKNFKDSESLSKVLFEDVGRSSSKDSKDTKSLSTEADVSTNKHTEQSTQVMSTVEPSPSAPENNSLKQSPKVLRFGRRSAPTELRSTSSQKTVGRAIVFEEADKKEDRTVEDGMVKNEPTFEETKSTVNNLRNVDSEQLKEFQDQDTSVQDTTKNGGVTKIRDVSASSKNSNSDLVKISQTSMSDAEDKKSTKPEPEIQTDKHVETITGPNHIITTHSVIPVEEDQQFSDHQTLLTETKNKLSGKEHEGKPPEEVRTSVTADTNICKPNDKEEFSAPSALEPAPEKTSEKTESSVMRTDQCPTNFEENPETLFHPKDPSEGNKDSKSPASALKERLSQPSSSHQFEAGETSTHVPEVSAQVKPQVQATSEANAQQPFSVVKTFYQIGPTNSTFIKGQGSKPWIERKGVIVKHPTEPNKFIIRHSAKQPGNTCILGQTVGKVPQGNIYRVQKCFGTQMSGQRSQQILSAIQTRIDESKIGAKRETPDAEDHKKDFVRMGRTLSLKSRLLPKSSKPFTWDMDDNGDHISSSDSKKKPSLSPEEPILATLRQSLRSKNFEAIHREKNFEVIKRGATHKASKGHAQTPRIAEMTVTPLKSEQTAFEVVNKTATRRAQNMNRVEGKDGNICVQNSNRKSVSPDPMEEAVKNSIFGVKRKIETGTNTKTSRQQMRTYSKVARFVERIVEPEKSNSIEVQTEGFWNLPSSPKKNVHNFPKKPVTKLKKPAPSTSFIMTYPGGSEFTVTHPTSVEGKAPAIPTEQVFRCIQPPSLQPLLDTGRSHSVRSASPLCNTDSATKDSAPSLMRTPAHVPVKEIVSRQQSKSPLVPHKSPTEDCAHSDSGSSNGDPAQPSHRWKLHRQSGKSFDLSFKKARIH